MKTKIQDRPIKLDISKDSLQQVLNAFDILSEMLEEDYEYHFIEEQEYQGNSKRTIEEENYDLIIK